MPVGTNYAPVSYVGNGAAVDFPANFISYEPDEVLLFRETLSTGAVTLVDPSDYNVTGVPNSISVNYEMDGNPVTNAYRLWIVRKTSIEQPLNITNSSGFFPAILTRQLDRIAMIQQEQKLDVDRAFKVDYGQTGGIITAGTEGQFASFDENGNIVPRAAGPGSGDVTGPASSVDNRIALFDGITGKLLKDSGIAIADGQISVKQATNGADTILVQRATDTSPTGHFFRFVNAANSDDLALMDIVGNLTIRGIFHAAGGYFGANGADPALNIDTDLGTTAAGSPAVYIRGSRNSERFIAHSYNSIGGLAGATVQLVSGRGTAVAPQPLQSGDRLGAYTAGGQFGTGLTDFAKGNAILEFTALENFASGNRGTGMLVKLTPAGTSSLVTVAQFQPGGSMFYQTANNADTFVFRRFTDTTPTGYIMRVVNAANSVNLAWIDVLGNANVAGFLDVGTSIYFKPAASVTPNDNGQVVFEFTNNTTLTVRAKGSDGTVRSGTVTLA